MHWAYLRRAGHDNDALMQLVRLLQAQKELKGRTELSHCNAITTFALLRTTATKKMSRLAM